MWTEVCLGDLARYRKQQERQNKFGKARSWYLKAVQLGPNNGRPYNQLGLLGHYTHRHLDAVYYFLRALSVKHSYGTARQTVSGVFESIHARVPLSFPPLFHAHLSPFRSQVRKMDTDMRADLEKERWSLESGGKGRRNRPNTYNHLAEEESLYRRQEIWYGRWGVDRGNTI